MKRVKKIIDSCKDPKLAKEFRKLYTVKLAQQYRANEADASVLSHTHGGVVDYETREHPRVGRGSKDSKEYKRRNYGDSPEGPRITEHPKFNDSIDEAARSLSTRYSPDRPGVQARFVSDGVRQDPYTNKLYNWNEGFKTEDGEQIPAGGVGLQTDLYSNATLSGIAFTKKSQMLPGDEDDPFLQNEEETALEPLEKPADSTRLSGDMPLAEGLQALLEAGVTDLESAIDMIMSEEQAEEYEVGQDDKEWRTDKEIFRDLEASKRNRLSKIANPYDDNTYEYIDPEDEKRWGPFSHSDFMKREKIIVAAVKTAIKDAKRYLDNAGIEPDDAYTFWNKMDNEEILDFVFSLKISHPHKIYQIVFHEISNPDEIDYGPPETIRDIESSKRNRLSKIANIPNSTNIDSYGYVLVSNKDNSIISGVIADPQSARTACDQKRAEGQDCVICELRTVEL